MTEAQRITKTQTVALSIIAAGVIIGVLIVGNSFLLPLAIAILVWNLLEAVIERLTHSFRLPRLIAMSIAISFVVIGFLIVIQIISSQGDAIVAEAPKYGSRLQDIGSSMGNWFGPEITAKIRTSLSELNFFGGVSSFLGSAQSTLANVALITIYVGFLLAESGHVSLKMGALFPDKAHFAHIRKIMASLSDNVRRYIWIKTIISLFTGLLSYGVLKYLEVDFAETWALMIFLLNYIPTIGSILGVIFPAIIALIQFDTYTTFLIIAVGLTAIQFVIGNVIEPMFMGNSLNLSSFAIILALTFWGSIWGPAGMVLSVPITVMMMIIAAHIPSWRWVAILLSKDGKIYTTDK